MAGGDVVTVLCGTPVRAVPRAWQQFQGVSTDINPPRFGTPLCWGPAGAGRAQSKSLVSVFSQIRDLDDVAACLEKVLGEIKQLQDAEGAQLPTVSGGAAQRPGGCNPTSHSPGTRWGIISQDILTSHSLGPPINTPPCLAWVLQPPWFTQGRMSSPGAGFWQGGPGLAAGAVHEAAGSCGAAVG